MSSEDQLKSEIVLLTAFFWEIRQLVSTGASEETLGEIDKICSEAIEKEPPEVSDGACLHCDGSGCTACDAQTLRGK